MLPSNSKPGPPGEQLGSARGAAGESLGRGWREAGEPLGDGWGTAGEWLSRTNAGLSDLEAALEASPRILSLLEKMTTR